MYAGSEVSMTDSAAVKEEVAYREAMDRHISEMEQRAAMAVFEKQEWEGHIQNCLLQEKDDIRRRRDLCEANSDFIKAQMEWNANKRKEGRKAFIENASAHDFPVFTEAPDNILQEQMKNQQQRLRADLDTQVRTNNTLRNLARQRERELEHNQLEANRQEMAMLRSLDKSKKDHQKEATTFKIGDRVKTDDGEGKVRYIDNDDLLVAFDTGRVDWLNTNKVTKV